MSDEVQVPRPYSTSASDGLSSPPGMQCDDLSFPPRLHWRLNSDDISIPRPMWSCSEISISGNAWRTSRIGLPGGVWLASRISIPDPATLR